MSGLRSRKFCCCIPVQFGLFLLSFIGLGVGVLLGVFGWWSIVLIKQNNTNLSSPNAVALYLSTAMYTLLALVSLFGFAGAIIKRIGIVSAFGITLLFHLIFSFGVGVYAIYTVFKQDPQNIYDQCMEGSSGNSSIEPICKNGSAIAKGASIAIFVVTWLLQLYAFFVVRRYLHQLEEEEALKVQVANAFVGNRPGPITTYSTFGSANQPRSAFVNSNKEA